jgi:hypothetical protein
MDAKTDQPAALLAERIRATEAVRDNAHSFHYVIMQNQLAIMRALAELLGMEVENLVPLRDCAANHEKARVENVTFSNGRYATNCLSCGKELVLKYNGGELDRAFHCNFVYDLVSRGTDFVVRELKPETP